MHENFKIRKKLKPLEIKENKWKLGRSRDGWTKAACPHFCFSLAETLVGMEGVRSLDKVEKRGSHGVENLLCSPKLDNQLICLHGPVKKQPGQRGRSSHSTISTAAATVDAMRGASNHLKGPQHQGARQLLNLSIHQLSFICLARPPGCRIRCTPNQCGGPFTPSNSYGHRLLLTKLSSTLIVF